MTRNLIAVLVRGVNSFGAIVIDATKRSQTPRLVLALDTTEIEARLAVLHWNDHKRGRAHANQCA